MHKDSMYTIRSAQTGLHKKLISTVKKHQSKQFMRPIREQQCLIFAEVDRLVKQSNKPIILDSGCGKASSSVRLAAQYPDHLVIGIDKSIHRLQANCVFAQGGQQDNLLLVHADLREFWQLAVQANWSVDKHYMLYPNPWPKPSQLNQRWYGHPCFFDCLRLGQTIILRSNWYLYVAEFSLAVQLATQQQTLIERLQIQPDDALSHFEKKYLIAGEKLYQCSVFAEQQLAC